MSKWYYNSRDGNINSLPEAIGNALLHIGGGWHGPFDTKDDAIAFYRANAAANPGWRDPTSTAGTNPIGDVASKAGKAVEGAAANAAKSAVSGIFGNLNAESLILRVGEILLGLVLIGVALAHLTGTGNIISKAVGAIPKV